MKLYKIIVAFTIAAICVVHGRPDTSNSNRPRIRKVKKEETTTEAPSTKKTITMLPKKEIKFVEPEKKPQPSLSVLYAGEKKPLMRKFIPQPKPRIETVTVSHRPLMKRRHFIIGPTTPKPQPIKSDVYIIPKRRKLNNPVRKSSLKAVTGRDDGDEYDRALNDDLMPSGSIKVYRKIIGSLRRKFNVKPAKTLHGTMSSKPTYGKSRYTYYVLKANDVALNPSAEENLRRYLEKKSDVINEEEDRKEFIFVPKPSSVAAKVESKEISTIKPTQTTLAQDRPENILMQPTPTITPQTVKIDTVFKSTPNVEGIIDTESKSTSSSVPSEDVDNLLPMNPTTSVAPKIIIEEPIVSKPNDASTENIVNDVSLQTTQSVSPSTDINLHTQSTPDIADATKRDIDIQSIQTTTLKATSSEELVVQSTSTSQYEEGSDNALRGDVTSHELEETDAV